MKALPDFLKPFFWDIDLARIDTSENMEFVIERILELGDENAVGWLFSFFPETQIKEVLSKSRRISAKSRNFWHFILEGQRNASVSFK